MKIVRGEEIKFVAASHEDPEDPGCLKRVLVGREDLVDGRIQMLNWCELPIGKSFQAHYHEDMQEVFVIIEGQAKMVVDDEEITLSKGDAILITAREVHKMTNDCNRSVKYLVFGISEETGGRTVVV